MELAAEFADLTSADGQQFCRVHAVTGEESVHVVGGRVPWRSVVEDDHGPACLTENECGVEACRTGSDYCYVE